MADWDPSKLLQRVLRSLKVVDCNILYMKRPLGFGFGSHAQVCLIVQDFPAQHLTRLIRALNGMETVISQAEVSV